MLVLCREPEPEAEEDAPSHVPGDGLAAYYAQGGQHTAEPIFDETIGLTVEAMPPGVTLQSLWNVL